ncbi:MAG: BREX-1 system adenine-specific DNA-methyltransferase PglX, partial [Pseudoclavibacter sp.]
MDTAALKSFATSARTELISEVGARITAVLAQGSPARVEQPRAVTALERAIYAGGGGDKGKAHVADKVAYTWFNRIVALRFMDANRYTGIGVVSPAADQVGQPEVLAAAKRGQIDGDVVKAANSAAVTALLNGTRQPSPGIDAQAEAYALLLADYCRYWNRAMPFMFEREGDYTELLIPANLLAGDSVLSRAVNVLTAEVCQDVEVIGWLYQFYISERKAEVFAGFKKNKKASADEIPAATQLFTPHWIVRYLVENSLGRLWMLNHPQSRLVDQMDYYIAPVDEETDFLKITKPEQLTVIDPACGSGHMLTYAFDLLYAIYEEEGYAPSQIPSLILTHNLFGTEIDPRAGALAAFALTMKATAKRKLFLKNPVEPNICVLDPINFSVDELSYLVTKDGDRLAEEVFWNQFAEADTFGSLIQPDPAQIARLADHLATLNDEGDIFRADALDWAQRVIRQAEFLLPGYSVVVANPPYMGAARMGVVLTAWLRKELPLGKAGLDVAFWQRSMAFLATGGRAALVTMQSWMFLATYADFRAAIVEGWTLCGALHLGSGAFPEISGEVVGTVAAVMSPSSDRKRRGAYVKLTASGNKNSDARKVAAGGLNELRFDVSLDDLATIPRTPIAYWMGEAERNAFGLRPSVATVCRSGNGLTSSDNDRFLRFWWEVGQSRIETDRGAGDEPSGRRWYPLNKGGGFRRWAGNRHYVIDWAEDGKALYDLRPASTVRNPDLYFRPSVSWSDVVTGPVSFRFYPNGWIFDASANSLFPTGDDIEGLLSFANSSFAGRMAPLLNPGLHFKLGDMGSLPYLKRTDHGWQEEIDELVRTAQQDWDSTETSAGFEAASIASRRRAGAQSRLSILAEEVAEAEIAITTRVHELESKNNTEIASQYGLDAEYAEAWPVTDVSLLQNPWAGRKLSDAEARNRQTQRLLTDLASYAVGCMLGRYSLDEPGLILADQDAIWLFAAEGVDAERGVGAS